MKPEGTPIDGLQKYPAPDGGEARWPDTIEAETRATEELVQEEPSTGHILRSLSGDCTPPERCKEVEEETEVQSLHPIHMTSGPPAGVTNVHDGNRGRR